jgi:hypothetical protein
MAFRRRGGPALPKWLLLGNARYDPLCPARSLGNFQIMARYAMIAGAAGHP